jgi:hypothetical protein
VISSVLLLLAGQFNGSYDEHQMHFYSYKIVYVGFMDYIKSHLKSII